MILNEADRDLYFPTVRAEGDELVGMIRRAQLAGESAIGANRALEIRAYTELLPVSQASQSVQLSFFPVLSTPTPVVETRSHRTIDGFGRTIPLTPWEVRPTADYVIDFESGRLNLYGNPAYPSTATQIRASYSSGFDFATETAETEEIKTAIGAIMMWLESLPGKGVTSLKSLGVSFAASYSPATGGYSIPEYLLYPLHKYKPRGS